MARNRYWGIKEETTFGTEAPEPMTYDLTDGVASMGLDAPDDPNIPIPTLNRFQTKHMPGFYSPSGGAEYTVDINSIGWFLKWALGGYKFTAGTGQNPNKHEFWAQQGYTLKSFTSKVGKDTFEHKFLGCVINKLSINIENELLTIKLDMIAQKDKKDTLRNESALTLIDPDLFPIAFYNADTKIDNVSVKEIVSGWSMEFDNGMKAEDGQGQGSRHPYLFRSGSGKISTSIKKNFDEGSSELEKFWADADGVSDKHHTPFAVKEEFSSGTFGNMNISMPRCYYTKVPTDLKGGDPRQPELGVMPEASIITLADTATEVLSPLLITLENFEGEYKLGSS